jgi:hypothetical protein
VTLLVDDNLADAAAPASRRRRWPWLVVGVVLLALVAACTSAIVYAHTYSPLGPGNFAGPTVGAMHGVTDGVDDPTRFIVEGPQGSTGRTSYSVENNGSHAVTILGGGLSADDDQSIGLSLSWSYPYDSHGDLLGAQFSHSRPFPATIDPHKQIAVFATITKPACPTGVTRELGQIPLRTEALGVHHVWNLTLGGGEDPFFQPIDVCSPKAALKHLTER